MLSGKIGINSNLIKAVVSLNMREKVGNMKIL